MTTDNRIEKSILDKRKLNSLFIYGIGLLEFILFMAIVMVAFKVTGLDLNDSHSARQFYSLCAMALMLLWIGILIVYYAWAIYFYNINLGLTNQDWAEIRERKQYVPEGVTEVPSDNPNASQTLGLPPGTLRGTIALTLLVCSIALAIASLGMDSNIKVNTFLVDNFDFFKTAFLMMIAFYFGNKALESIGYKSPGSVSGPAKTNPANPVSPASESGAPLSPIVESATEKKKEMKQNPLIENQAAATGVDDFDNPQAVQ